MYLCVCACALEGTLNVKKKKVLMCFIPSLQYYKELTVQYCFTGTLIAEKQKAEGRKFTKVVSRLSTYVYVYTHTQTLNQKVLQEHLFSDRCRTSDLQLGVIFAV